MKKLTSTSLRFIPGALGLACCLLASHATAAVLYFDPNGASPVTAGTYTWDTTSLEWSTSSALTGSPIAWNTADAACFCAGSFTGNITVMVNSAITAQGFFDGNLTPPGCNLTLAGTGSLNWTGNNAVGAGGSDANSVSLNIPITDGTSPAAIQIEQDGVNNIYMYAHSTFTGNITIGPSATGININNNNSFGVNNSSQIIANSSSATRAISMPLAAQTGPITLNQTWNLWNGNLTFAGVQAYPLTLAGPVSVVASGTSTITVQPTTDVGAGTPTVTISGIISGAGNFAKAGPSTLLLSGANTYSGSTTISAGRLTLGAANTIATSSSVIMAGGTLDPDGFHHVMSGTLSLTANSTIDYTSGTAEIDFADSSAATWTAGKTLNLVSTGGGNWNTSGDELNFNENPIGLDAVRLSQIEFNGTDLGDAAINDNGFIFDSAQPIPEPSTIVLSLLGGLGLLWNIRRRAV